MSEKVSSAKSVGVRVGPRLRSDLEALAATLAEAGKSVTLSEILREGCTALWPQIRAYTLARHTTGLDADQITRLTLVAAQAAQHGITSEQIEAALADLVEQKLTA